MTIVISICVGRDRRAIADTVGCEKLMIGQVATAPWSNCQDRQMVITKTGANTFSAAMVVVRPHDEDLGLQQRHGDRPEALQPGGAIEFGSLLQRWIDAGKARHEHDKTIPQLQPDHDNHQRDTARGWGFPASSESRFQGRQLSRTALTVPKGLSIQPQRMPAAETGRICGR